MTFRATARNKLLGCRWLVHFFFSVVGSFLVNILYNVIHAFIVLTLNFSVKTVSKHSLLYPRQKKEREIIETFWRRDLLYLVQIKCFVY